MKSDTSTVILAVVLGVLVVVGAVLAINVAFQTRTFRAMQQMARISQIRIATAEGLFNDSKVYYQKYPTPELARILQSVQSKTPSASPTPTPTR